MFKNYTISSLWEKGAEGILTITNKTPQSLPNWYINVKITGISSITFYNFDCVKNSDIYTIKPKSWTPILLNNSEISSGFNTSTTGSVIITPITTAPTPITPAPITPAPITPAPITPAPITPAPITPTKDYTEYIEPKNGKDIVMYHCAWSTYDRDFQICDLPIDYISTVVYAFYNVNPDGTIFTGDAFADIGKVFNTRGVNPLDSWSDNLTYHGNFGQLLKLKQSGKKFNLFLSVGGWTYSKNFSPAVSTATTRQTFVKSILNVFNKYPIFNGIDLDWEYLSDDGINYGNAGNIVNKNDARNFIEFLKLLRTSLNNDNKKHYKISIAVTADPKIIKFPVKEVCDLVDKMKLMTYDFASGSWGKISTHQTNLYPASYTKYSASESVNAYISQGATAGKICIGAAFYSRGSANSEGLGKSCSGNSPDKSWENGICDYKTLPRNGSVEYWDDQCKATYSYDSDKKIFNSYDSTQSITEKCNYITSNGLKGIIIWETSGDLPYSNARSLTKALYIALISNIPAPGPTPAPGPKPEPKPELVQISINNPKSLYFQYDKIIINYNDVQDKTLIILKSNIININYKNNLLTINYKRV